MKQHRKILNWVLGALLLCVWGGVGYQILSTHSGDESDSLADKGLLNNSDGKLKTFHYAANVKDPFQFFVPVAIHHEVPKKPPEKLVPVAPKLPQFPFRLLGIVNNDRRQTAILESQDGTVSFLGKGDTLQGMKVLDIQQNVVRYVFFDTNGELVLSSTK
jgi:hypothetical protein